MTVFAQPVLGTTVSDGWLRAASALAERRPREAFHLVVRFSRPTEENQDVREAVDRMLRDLGLQDVDAVANTIFPHGMAESSRDPGHLVERYRQTYPHLQKATYKNNRGTYFGRLVERPHGDGDVDQFSHTIGKLRTSVEGGRQRWKSSYEVDIADPDLAMSTYVAEKDRNVHIGFPCLSFLSFHLDAEALHLSAHYRSQYMIERGYGNYLGLGRLLGYVAEEVGVAPGELLVVGGHARIDNTWRNVKPHLERMPDLDANEGGDDEA